MDLKEVFKNFDIEYWTSGKNVSKGWINIQCLYCDDDSNHLGISLSTLDANCWKCGKKNIFTILKTITGYSTEEVKELIKEIPKEADSGLSSSKRPFIREMLPSDISKKFKKRHKKFLRDKGFVPGEVIKQYDLYSTWIHDRYPFRIIIPVKYNRNVISFTTRDVTEKQGLRYDSASNIKDTIYNYDDIKKDRDVLIAEGPIDAWKMGKGGICLFGVNPTERQIVLLLKKRIKTAFIIFDNDDAGIKNRKLIARNISPLVRNVKILKLKKYNDPGEIDKSFFETLKRQIGFDI